MYMSSVHVYMPAMQLYKLSCCTCQVYIISGCVVVCAKCVCVYVASVSISAGCGVFIVRICYMPRVCIFRCVIV